MNDGKRIVKPFQYLRGISWTSFENARDHSNERFNNLIISILFSAFCLEAFLNHVGQEKISSWEDIERGLSPKGKLAVISEILKFSPDFSTRPFSNFHPLFKLRNVLVHAKTEDVDKFENGEEMLSWWEAQITLETAKNFLDDTKEMICQISNVVGYDQTILDLERPQKIENILGLNSMTSS